MLGRKRMCCSHKWVGFVLHRIPRFARKSHKSTTTIDDTRGKKKSRARRKDYILSLAPVGRRRRQRRVKGNSTVVRQPERAMVRVHPGPFLPGFQFFQKLKRSRDDDFFSSSSFLRRRRGARRRVRVAAVAVVRSTTTEKHDWCLSSSVVSFSFSLNCVLCVSTLCFWRFLWLFWRFYFIFASYSSNTRHERHLWRVNIHSFSFNYFKKKDGKRF